MNYYVGAPGQAARQARRTKKANLALARKLAVIMHRMLVNGMCFRDVRPAPPETNGS